jgi:protein-disulfide isomerase
MSITVETIAPDDHVRGPANARLTLIEYGDFECPHCAAAAPVVRSVLAELPGDLRLVFRHYPIVISHREAHLAAQASEAAAAQGRFWEMHDLLFQRQASLSRTSLLSYAGELRLDVGRVSAELESGRYVERVDRDLELGEEIGVRWTPTFYLNGRRLGPLPDPSQLLGIVRSA